MNETWDVIIVGAGTAGAAAALHCARRGLRTLCLEAQPLDRAGARFSGAIPGWCFEAAGIAPSEPPERMPSAPAHRMVLPRSGRRFTVPNRGVLDVDLAALLDRIQGAARRAGAELRGEVRVAPGPVAPGTPRLRTSEGPLEARYLVDASGAGGARLLGQPAVRPRDTCAACHQLHEVADPAGRRRYLAAHGAEDQQNLAFLAPQGGYSTLNVRANGERVGVLAGTVPADGHPPGAELVRRFVADNPWIGPLVHGGRPRSIPLRRPLDRPALGATAALGDAAFQVFGVHGSGVGNGMIAARLLAEALASGRGPEAYAAAFQRKLGGDLASFDLLRRYNQGRPPRELEQLFASGLLSPRSIRLVLAQRTPWPTPGEAAILVRGAALAPALVPGLLTLVARMALVRALYAAYPASPAGLGTWTAALDRLGLEPDPSPVSD